MMAIKTRQIYDEESKETPDEDIIAKLREERFSLFQERSDLRVKDRGKIVRIRSEYGAIIRTPYYGNESS